ncbi:efflux RND transporter periplasmic adaptor subunit [Azospirillum brasilense]|uniref:Efflux transporter periplasmic adaptor subunit n=1 Tax=Azospirillum brasilense TaxID=192 RepID=A0A235HDP6_AZOBR|nr:efflux RND transporter periplasmic adaptor subunit [Azospirillum brasilense]OYD83868.1 efflux transporter periplasmic adaptor subunit [Azospirillum brasilense]
MHISRIAAVSVIAATLAGCQEHAPPEPGVRPVRAITVERNVQGAPVTLTGQVRAQDQANLSFRLDGRLLERRVNVGDLVQPGQIVGKLDPQIQQNSLRQAQAGLSAAQAQLVQARNAFRRQQELLKNGWTTNASFDQAQQALDSAEAQVTSSRAQMHNAEEMLSYTDLLADTAGTVTATGAEPGEVLRAGQMVVQVARQGGRDAVFDVPSQLIRTAPRDPVVAVSLAEDPSVTATGRVREVAPQADPTTRTFQVKVGLIDPPDAMRLGATVAGRIRLSPPEGVDVPASALTQSNGRPAVWVFDRKNQTVSLRSVEISQHEPASVVISQGLAAGEVVVTAGAQVLRPGQKVRLLGDES